MNKKQRNGTTRVLLLIGSLLVAGGLLAQDIGVAAVNDTANILPVMKREQLQNEWLRWRLDNLIPQLMRREGIDMWLVINRECNEDPVYLKLVPQATFNARRTTILIFHDRGEKLGVDRLSASHFSFRGWYERAWTDKSKTQFENLADIIRERDPKKIGINVSEHIAFGDGLTAALKDKLVNAIGPKYASRLVSAERLCVGWLETRSPQEMVVYRHICGVAHDMIRDFYSNKVITPGITSTEDVEAWIRQRIVDLGLECWFSPEIFIARKKDDPEHQKGWYLNDYAEGPHIIQRGDLLHCDYGLKYLGLNTDMQWEAYVCREGEEDAPAGFQKAMHRAQRVAEIFMGEFKTGRTGSEIAQAATAKANAEGLRATIYTHPIGVDVHAAGPSMDGRPHGELPESNAARGALPLYPNTAYAIEFMSVTSIPEWGGQDIRFGFEEQAIHWEDGCRFIDGYQKKFLLIK